jgi:hypothetical protein
VSSLARRGRVSVAARRSANDARRFLDDYYVGERDPDFGLPV